MKNRSNEIRSNEIRIMRELPVAILGLSPTILHQLPFDQGAHAHQSGLQHTLSGLCKYQNRLDTASHIQHQ